MTRRRTSSGWLLAAFVTSAGCMEPGEPWRSAPPPDPSGQGIAPGDTVARSRVSAELSRRFVFFFAALPWGLIAAWSVLWWSQHRRTADAERAFDPRAPLTNGFAVIHGQVELEAGATGPAIQLGVRQRGSHWRSKQGWHHQWKETARAVRVRPFWVRTFAGERVRVEPDERVVLRDDLSRLEQSTQFDRVRFAEVTPGETVHVSGSLFGAGSGAGAAYRAAHTEPVLRPSRLSPMMVSTERPGDTSEQRARHHRRWILAAVAALVLLPLTVFPTMTALLLTGTTVWARPVATRHWQVFHKPKNRPGYWVQHYGLRSVRDAGGRTQTLTDECSAALVACVEEGACPAVPYTVSALSDDLVQLGVGAQLTDGRVILLGFLAAAVLLTYPFVVIGGRPWYLRRRVVDGGAGQLPDFFSPPGGPPPTAFGPVR